MAWKVISGNNLELTCFTWLLFLQVVVMALLHKWRQNVEFLLFLTWRHKSFRIQTDFCVFRQGWTLSYFVVTTWRHSNIISLLPRFVDLLARPLSHAQGKKALIRSRETRLGLNIYINSEQVVFCKTAGRAGAQESERETESESEKRKSFHNFYAFWNGCRTAFVWSSLSITCRHLKLFLNLHRCHQVKTLFPPPNQPERVSLLSNSSQLNLTLNHNHTHTPTFITFFLGIFFF